jgi:hypothetical protein
MGRWGRRPGRVGSVYTWCRSGLPPDAVFVDGPQLEGHLGEGGGDCAQERA